MLEEQKREALRSMKKPKDTEISLLLEQLKFDQEFALSQYVVGICVLYIRLTSSYLCRFAPQLHAFRLDLDLWSGFVHGLRVRTTDFRQSSWTQEQIQSLQTLLVTRAISCVQLPIASAPKGNTAQPLRSLFTATVQVLLALCTETNNVALCSSVFQKIFVAASSAVGVSIFQPPQCYFDAEAIPSGYHQV